MYHGIAVNQYHFFLPQYKTPTESWPLQELKLTFGKNVPKKISTLLLPTNDIPNIISKTVNITKEHLTIDEELEMKKNYFPIVERKSLLLDNYFLYDRNNFFEKNH